MALSLLLASVLITSVSAFPWFGPRETISAASTANWTPAPTNAVYAAAELFKRGYYPVNVCGWQGPNAQLATCGSGSSCAWFTDYSVVGCCNIGGSCDAVFTSCLDGNHPAQPMSLAGVVTCKSDQVCYLNTFPSGYHQYGCGSTSVGMNVVTSYAAFGSDPGSNPELSIAIVYTGGVLDAQDPLTALSETPNPTTEVADATSSSAAASTFKTATPKGLNGVTSTSANSAGGPGSATSTTNDPQASSTSSTDPSGGGSNGSNGLLMGAKIAIRVSVPLLLLILVALVIFFCLRRRKSGAGNADTEPEAVAMPPAYSHQNQPESEKEAAAIRVTQSPYFAGIHAGHTSEKAGEAVRAMEPPRPSELADGRAKPVGELP